ncbi:MAG TPA: hypothetical protein VK502_04415, partial [Candidatus Saccharimonadales bacterium]|nr:hypothetical protein [Candidatus Saccharimonadales bacterium]
GHIEDWSEGRPTFRIIVCHPGNKRCQLVLRDIDRNDSVLLYVVGNDAQTQGELCQIIEGIYSYETLEIKAMVGRLVRRGESILEFALKSSLGRKTTITDLRPRTGKARS